MTWRAACFAGVLLLVPNCLAAAPAGGPLDARGAEGVGASIGPTKAAEQPASFDVEDLKRRLAEKGFALGSPIMIRIFKSEADLELWVRKDGRFELFAVYPVCNWSGTLGPKLAEGDKQSPEGLYSVGSDQLHRTGRWRRSLDIGFPNTYDKAHGRTGSYILVHGGCTTTGCYAMTDLAMEEIFTLSEAALEEGQDRIHVHAFPFRMTESNFEAHGQSPWRGFWLSLKKAYDAFERTRLPPRVRVCGDRYAIGESPMDGSGECVANASEASGASARARNVRKVVRARRARRLRATRRTLQSRQVRGGSERHARRTGGAARAARVADQGKAMRLGGPRRPRE